MAHGGDDKTDSASLIEHLPEIPQITITVHYFSMNTLLNKTNNHFRSKIVLFYVNCRLISGTSLIWQTDKDNIAYGSFRLVSGARGLSVCSISIKPVTAQSLLAPKV